MGLLNYLADFLRRNLLILIAISFCSYAVGDLIGNLLISGNTISSLNTDGDIILDPNGSGGVLLNDLTASRVLILDSNKQISSSSVTDTALGYVDFTSSGQTQLDAKLDDFTSSFDNVLLRTNGTSGDAVQDSGVTVDDSDVMGGITQLNVDNLRFDGNTISATDANGDVRLLPAGNGVVDVLGLETAQVDIRSANELRFQDTTGGQYMGFKAPGTVTSSTTLTLPNGAGTSGQVLSTNGTDTLSWVTQSGGGGVTVESKSASFTAEYGKLYLVDTSSGDVTATLTTASGNSGKSIEFFMTDGTNELIIDGASTETIATVKSTATTFTLFLDNEYARVTSDDTNLKMTGLVLAEVVVRASLTTGDTGITSKVIAFDTENEDNQGAHSSGTFTAPADGYYRFSCGIAASDLSATDHSIALRKNGSGLNQQYGSSYTVTGSGGPAMSSLNVSLIKGDTLQCFVTGDASFSIEGASRSYMSINRIGL
jgi:hypothetical protein